MSGAVDIWVNLLPPEALAAFTGQPGFEGIGDLFGEFGDASGLDVLIGVMDRCGVDAGIMVGGLSAGTEDMLNLADKHPGRLYVAAMVDAPSTPTANARRVRELRASFAGFRLVRVAPLVSQVPINDRLWYPVYAACEELGVPVAINVGVPGPRVRSACQDPVLLEDVLIDFPDLVVIGAHMGHPYEALLMQYMLKWPNLYLSTTAYLPKYMDPALVKFMDSSRGRGRVVFGSDHPFLSLPRAIESARALPLSADAMDAFLGGTARRLLLP